MNNEARVKSEEFDICDPIKKDWSLIVQNKTRKLVISFAKQMESVQGGNKKSLIGRINNEKRSYQNKCGFFIDNKK